MALVGPNGAARFDFYSQYRLAVGADASVPLHLTDSLGANIDLTVYTGGYLGAGRRTRNETLTQANATTGLPEQSPALFDLAATSPGAGLLTLTVAGTDLAQDTPGRGFYDLFGINAAGDHVLLVTGRWECAGGTLDPALPAAP